MTYDYLHEVETVKLCSPMLQSVPDLLPVFERLGFTLHEDVVSLDRNETIPPWQHSSIVEVKILYNGQVAYGFDEGEWNVILLEYLFATLPFELADEFIDVVFKLSRELNTLVRFRGDNVTVSALKELFDQIHDEVLSETNEDPGSEGLALMIRDTYPRSQIE